MPTNVRRRAHTQVTLGLPELVHLMTGDCLLSGGCALCDEVSPDAPGALRIAQAQAIWNNQHAVLLATWHARLEARGEPGSFFPCFAEVVLDGVDFPALNPAWPAVVQERWHVIASNLYSHAQAQLA